MRSYQLAKLCLSRTVSAAVIVAMSASTAGAVKFPSKKNRYMSKPLHVCDQGIFYVGGAPKLTAFGAGPTVGPVTQIIIGCMFVQFQIPMKAKSWPLIMVHGSGYTGSCVQGTAGGTEGWADHTVRNGVPTYVVDQSGRARSGFDKSVIHEGEFLIASNPTAAAALIPTIGGSTSTAWNSWFGHIIPEPTADVTTGQMVRHGAPGDPLCATEPRTAGRPVPSRWKARHRQCRRVAHRTWGTRWSGHRDSRSSRRPRQRELPAERSLSRARSLQVQRPQYRSPHCRARSARPASRRSSTASAPGRRRLWQSWSWDWAEPSLRPTPSRESSVTT